MLSFFKSGRLSNLPQPMPMEIVCGDCAGDEIYPQKTNLMSDGSCAKCGGRSFVCAGRLFKMLTQHLRKQNNEVIK